MTENPKIKDLMKLHSSGDIVVIFEDGTGLMCENPIQLTKKDLRRMLNDELSVVTDSHKAFVKLESIIKNFGEEPNANTGDEPTEPDGETEQDDESGDGDS
jgi:TusA-related sulfurtransferase